MPLIVAGTGFEPDTGAPDVADDEGLVALDGGSVLLALIGVSALIGAAWLMESKTAESDQDEEVIEEIEEDDFDDDEDDVDGFDEDDFDDDEDDEGEIT